VNGEAAAGPLAGIRVLDLTRLLPGPVCTLYLADLGAEVVKIEDTGPGDYARGIGTRPGAVSAFYRAVNRNKRSVSLNLKDARGRALFLGLARDSDVVVEGFRPGVVASLGIDHESIAAINARIVYASISGYGQSGPRATASITWGTRACSISAARAAARRRSATSKSPTCSAARRQPRSRYSPRSWARSAPGAAATSTSRWPMPRSRTTFSRCTR
jgi:hypothetical protein